MIYPLTPPSTRHTYWMEMFTNYKKKRKSGIFTGYEKRVNKLFYG